MIFKGIKFKLESIIVAAVIHLKLFFNSFKAENSAFWHQFGGDLQVVPGPEDELRVDDVTVQRHQVHWTHQAVPAFMEEAFKGKVARDVQPKYKKQPDFPSLKTKAKFF